MTVLTPTPKEIAQSIGWLSGDTVLVDWDTADYSNVDEDGLVKIEGRHQVNTDLLVYAYINIERVEVHYSPPDSFDEDFHDDFWDEDEETDDSD